MPIATFGLIITFTARPGMRDALVTHLVSAGQSYTSEKGTQQFVVATSPTAPNTVTVIERYTDHAAHAEHEAAGSYAAIRAKTGEFLAGPPQVIPLQIAGGKL